MVRLYTAKTYFDASDITYEQAAALHAEGKPFDVTAKGFGDGTPRRMSIANSQVIRIEDRS